MPFQMTTFSLPSGARCARIDWQGLATGPEADQVIAAAEPGGSTHGLPCLVLSYELTGLDLEARRIFSSKRMDGIQTKMAMVVSNPLIRVAVNFIMRVRRNGLQRLFTSEAEAIRWLDQPAGQGG